MNQRRNNPISHGAPIATWSYRVPFRLQLAMLFIAALLVALAFNGTRALWDTSETRYAEASREMAVTGNWLVPRIDGQPHLTKPPVAYWLYGASIKLFGTSEWAVRLPCAIGFALGTLLTALVAFQLTRRRGTAMIAGIFYLVSPLALAASNTVTTDILLAAAEPAYIWAFFKTLNARRGLARRWAIITWAFMALAFMIKGPPGLLSALPCVVFLALKGRHYHWKPLVAILPLGVFAALSLAWYAIVLLRVPGAANVWKTEALRKVFVNSSRDMPAVAYLGILAVGALPALMALSGWLSKTTAINWRARLSRLPANNRILFCILWIIIPLCIFMLAKTRLTLYVLPLLSPINILAAMFVSRKWKTAPFFSWNSIPTGWKTAGLVILVLFTGVKICFNYIDDESKNLRPVALAIKDDAALTQSSPQLLLTMPVMGNGLLYYLGDPPTERIAAGTVDEDAEDQSDLEETGQHRHHGSSYRLRTQGFMKPISPESNLYIVLQATKRDRYLEKFGDYILPVFENSRWVVWRRTAMMDNQNIRQTESFEPTIASNFPADNNMISSQAMPKAGRHSHRL